MSHLTDARRASTLAALLLLMACGESTPSAPDFEPGPGSDGNPVVSSAEPRLIPPNASIDLHVFGSGFDEGSHVDLATDGTPAPRVRTDSTRFVSEDEVVATITTAANVPPGPYDVVLTSRTGKQGVGTELVFIDSTSGVQVITSTIGAADDEGYLVVIDGLTAAGHHVDPTGFVAVTGLSPGDHVVALEDVPESCAVSGDHPRIVSVPRGGVVQVFFQVECAPPPAPPPPPSPPPAPPPPGGNVLAFTDLSQSGDYDIHRIGADGQGRFNLTQRPGVHDVDPAWSPDGSRIAFVSATESGPSQIYVMRVDGSDVRQLTTGSQSAGQPQWSPDGSRIAFAGGGGIFVMRADGSQIRQLATGISGVLKWSPDGSKIAFSDYWEWRVADLYVVNADGTGKRLLHAGSAFGGLTWSPDGSRIAYDAWADGGGGCACRSISIVDSDGSNHVALTSAASHDSFGPTWSPDGSRIAFARSRGGADFSSDIGIFVVDVNGAGLTQLTHGASLGYHPMWSPDGSQIALYVGYPQALEIAVVNSDGTGFRTLGPGYGPTWQP